MVSTGGSGGGPGPPSAAAAVRWLQARRCGQLRGAGNGNSAAGPRAAAGEGAAGNGRGGGMWKEGLHRRGSVGSVLPVGAVTDEASIPNGPSWAFSLGRRFS